MQVLDSTVLSESCSQCSEAVDYLSYFSLGVNVRTLLCSHSFRLCGLCTMHTVARED